MHPSSNVRKEFVSLRNGDSRFIRITVILSYLEKEPIVECTADVVELELLGVGDNETGQVQRAARRLAWVDHHLNSQIKSKKNNVQLTHVGSRILRDSQQILLVEENTDVDGVQHLIAIEQKLKLQKLTKKWKLLKISIN